MKGKEQKHATDGGQVKAERVISELIYTTVTRRWVLFLPPFSYKKLML